MYCRYCGKELPEDSNFCPSCGKKQEASSAPIHLRINRIMEMIKGHKKIVYFYTFWFLLNLSLFIFSKPKEHHYEEFKGWIEHDYSGAFYPFSHSLGEILNGENFWINILYVDRYDFTEFFFYVVLLPFLVYGVAKFFPLKSILLKIKNAHNHQKSDGSKKNRANNQDEGKTYPSEMVSENVTKQQKAYSQDGNACKDSETGKKKMSLLLRFLGSLIDKVLILHIFVIGFTVIQPYASSVKLGKYIGLFDAKLEAYEYIDMAEIDKYDETTDDVSEYFQHGVKSEMAPPYLGFTLDLDKTITFAFIILNIVYYILSESLLSASPGKRMLRGVILDTVNDRIGFSKVLVRGLFLGALMTGIYCLLHLVGKQTNTVVVIVFFLILDLPVFFTKASLLDLCTGTFYAKR